MKKNSIFARHRVQQEAKKTSGIKKILLGLAVLVTAGILAVAAIILYAVKDLPDISNINEIIFAQSSVIYDRNGIELYTIHGDENRKIVAIEEMPDSLIQATISIEDAAFFEHHGFSITGIIRAVLSEIFSFGSHKSGGSTLTQQFVKNTFLSSEKTYTRKIKELILSLQLELHFTKDEILGMYLNSIPYGANSHGAEQASLTFFGKSVHELNVEESVILAALPNAPSYYSPYGSNTHTSINLSNEELLDANASNYQELLEELGSADLVQFGLLPTLISLNNGNSFLLPGRTSLVLERMLELNFLDKAEADQYEQDLSEFKFQKYRVEMKAPHFVMYVRNILEEKYGKEFVNAGGLKVYTTLDYKLQEQAEKIVAEQAAINLTRYDANNAALLSVKPQTGEIIAMVGSKDYWDEETDGNVNIHLQRRLAGSSFKPFAYAAAFSQGLAPATVVFDVETDFGNDYTPQNYDGKFHGPVTLRHSLGNSFNIPAIKAAILGGQQRTYDIAKGMGINFQNEADHYGSAIALGVAEVRPMDMTQAYAAFANLGKRVELTPFLKIEDRNGNILESLSKNPEQKEVLDEETAYLVTDVLADPNARGPGWNTMLQLPGRVNAVKTGTSNKRKDEDTIAPLDGWTIGYTPNLVTAVWAGNNNGKTMNNAASGFVVAGPIWRNFMIAALKDQADESFAKPQGITSVQISKLTGKLPSPNFPSSLITQDIFSQQNIPNEYDTSLKIIEVEQISGDLPSEFTPESAKKKVAVLSWSSLRPWDENWEKPAQEWIKNYAANFLKSIGVDDVIAEAPENIEKIHTQNNILEIPEIQITSPVSFGEVGQEGVGVWTEIQSIHGVAFVDFYLNGKLVDTQNTAPFKGEIIFPEDAKIGDSFTITAKVLDTLYNSSSASVEVKIAKDSQAPHTEIIFPKNNANFASGSIVSIQTYSYDTRTNIAKVEFFLDDEKQATTSVAPYQSDLVLSQETGTHTLKIVAYDSASNTAEDEITINVSPKKISRDFKVSVDKEIQFGDSVTVNFFIPVDDTKDLASVELVARYQSDAAKVADTILFSKEFAENNEQSISGIFSALWVRPLQGEYQVFVRAKYTNKKVLSSAKETVIVK